MSYEIRTLGESVETVKSREEAVWVLGPRYGNALLVEGKKNKAIVFTDKFVKINPLLLEEAKEEIIKKKIKKGYGIS